MQGMRERADVLQLRLGHGLHRFRHGVEHIGLRAFLRTNGSHALSCAPGSAAPGSGRKPRAARPRTPARRRPPPVPGTPPAPGVSLRGPSVQVQQQLAPDLGAFAKTPIRPGTSVLPHSSAPMITSMHWRSSSIRGVKQTPSARNRRTAQRNTHSSAPKDRVWTSVHAHPTRRPSAG